MKGDNMNSDNINNNEDYEDIDDPDMLSPEQQQLVMQTYMTFVQNFVDYVKQVDPALYKRAKEYATDYTQVPGISIVDPDQLLPEDDQ